MNEIQILRKNLDYLHRSWKKQGYSGATNFLLRILDGVTLRKKCFAKPSKLHITSNTGICNIQMQNMRCMQKQTPTNDFTTVHENIK